MAKILVIDDEVPLLEEVLEWLTFEGYETIGAQDGRQGLDLARQHLPDLIVSDIMMPEMNGYKVLVELRMNPATAFIPVIFLTARAGRRDVRYGMELGASDYITKPFSCDEMVAAVKTQLEKQLQIRQQSEQALNSLRENLTFALPHELRTPLVGILGYAELIAMDAKSFDPDSITQMAEEISKSGRRLHRLIENYLGFANLELLRSNPDKAEFFSHAHADDVAGIVNDVCTELSQQYERPYDISVNVANFDVGVSPDNLQKVMTELIDNAFKFSKAGASVEVSATADAGGVTFTVLDHGRGMTPDEIQHIGAYLQFRREVFEQQGSGLGLIIAKRLIELHGGTLMVESEPEAWTKVTFSVPKRG